MASNIFENLEIAKLFPLMEAIAEYHDYKVHGLDKLPKTDGALIVSNHSLATYDLALLYFSIYKKTGRFSKPLMDRLFSKIPLLGEFMEALGARVGDRKTALNLLKGENLVAVAPGGMLEALRPSTEKYQIRWDGRRGFVRLAIQAQKPIFLAACPQADDLYDVYKSKLTDMAYQLFKVPVPIAAGLAYTIIPKPVALEHHIEGPFHPPKWSRGAKKLDEMTLEFHHDICQKMQELMDRTCRKTKKKRVAKKKSKTTKK
ncbi:MAG: acyltransferase family protein [Oligoflexales bacterium]|nr:acyltransferase family protein [Oligoflexales bacterium]